MKKIFLFTISFILLAFVFSSCKKDKVEKQETVAQKLQHKWAVDGYTSLTHDSNGDETETYVGVAGDYMDIKPDGTYEIKMEGDLVTETYSLINDDTQILVDGVHVTIKTLTGSKLVLYSKQQFSVDEYYEFTLTLSK